MIMLSEHMAEQKHTTQDGNYGKLSGQVTGIFNVAGWGAVCCAADSARIWRVSNQIIIIGFLIGKWIANLMKHLAQCDCGAADV